MYGDVYKRQGQNHAGRRLHDSAGGGMRMSGADGSGANTCLLYTSFRFQVQRPCHAPRDARRCRLSDRAEFAPQRASARTQEAW